MSSLPSPVTSARATDQHPKVVLEIRTGVNETVLPTVCATYNITLSASRAATTISYNDATQVFVSNCWEMDHFMKANITAE